MGKLFAGLDVSDAATAVCVVRDTGELVLEVSTETTPEAIVEVLRPLKRQLQSVGLESGLRSAWLHKHLVAAKYPALCLDAKHAHASLSARLNKTDQNDARGLAELLARGLYTLAHIKSDDAIRIKVALGRRTILVEKANALRRSIDAAEKQLAAPVRKRSRSKPTEWDLLLADTLSRSDQQLTNTLEFIDGVIRKQTYRLQKLAKGDAVCRRLMSIPGVGPVTALMFRASIDDPQRFTSSRDVAAYLGLTPRIYQSGLSTRSGGISHAGDVGMRSALYNAANALLTLTRRDFPLKAWGKELAKRRGHKVACVALARKLAVLMHHLWVTGEKFDPSR